MRRYLFPILLCCTLGLAPFLPEPHLVGKIRWLAGGGVGMQTADWLDLVGHAFPFGLLLAVAAHHALPPREVDRETE